MMREFESRSVQSWLEGMERAAETALQNDPSFFEALQALKWEVDKDPRVRGALRDLEEQGHSVFNSFVPQIRIRLRGGEKVFARTRTREASQVAAVEHARLTRELRDAASAVIANSRYRRELDGIVNEAVHASEEFERMASSVESAGYMVLICLDLSAYAQLRKEAVSPVRPHKPRGSGSTEETPGLQLSPQDSQFLKALHIRLDELPS